MAKISRFATTRIAASLNADYRADENVKDSFYLDGRIARKRESRGADISSLGEDRGFFYAVFASHDLNIDSPGSESITALNNLTEAIKQSNDKIDNEINDLADCAVEVGGRATIAREGVRQSYFAGIIVKEAEVAAVTTGGACAFLYRNNAVFPLTGCDIELVNADYHGNAIDNMNDFSAGVAGTIRYSNIAQLQSGDGLILCNKEVMEAVGQRELLSVLYNYDDSGDAAAEIIDRARDVNPDDPLQILIASVEEVIPADRTGKINLGLFQTAKDLSDQATTRYEPIQNEPEKVAEPAYTAPTVTETVPDIKLASQELDQTISNLEQTVAQKDDPFKPSYSISDDAVSDEFAGLEEQEVSRVEFDTQEISAAVSASSASGENDIPVFEPIIAKKAIHDSDDFEAGKKYADEDFYNVVEEPYGSDQFDEQEYDDHIAEDQWQDDRAVLSGNRNRDYDDYGYEDNYEMYQSQTSGGSKSKQYILYAALGLICVACIVALYFMLFKKDAKPKELGTDPSQQIDVSDQGTLVPTVTEEADIRTPVKQDSDETQDPTATDATAGTDKTTDDTSGDAAIAVNDTIYVTADALFVRSGPNTDSAQVTTLYAGAALTVTELADGWYGITTEDGTSGYVHADYVSKTAP
ncbi:MAG TPA: SH3 domain-containing protein [Clostridiaceae bacterium]|nr:SH3 domain-containing protein [Clostridiaceae bacterium]